MGDGPENIKLWQVRHRCRARWRRTTRPPRQSRGVEVKLGLLLDSQLWYVDVIKPDFDECRAYPDEQSAWTVARAWMDKLGGEWEQIACDPTAEALPEARRQAQERAQPSTGSQSYSGSSGEKSSTREHR